MRQVKSLLKNDMKNISRDYLNMFMLIYPWIIILIVRFGVPPLKDYLLGYSSFDLTEYYYLLLIFAAILIPFMMGSLLALMFLDERDDDVLKAIRITPLSLSSYLSYKFIFIGVLSVFLIMVTVPLCNLIEVNLFHLFIVAVTAALMVPFNALLINSISSNKVSGMAVIKGTGFLIILPLASLFIHSKWNILFGILPTYWSMQGFAAICDPSLVQFPLWLFVIVGLIYPTVLIKLLYDKFVSSIS